MKHRKRRKLSGSYGFTIPAKEARKVGITKRDPWKWNYHPRGRKLTVDPSFNSDSGLTVYVQEMIPKGKQEGEGQLKVNLLECLIYIFRINTASCFIEWVYDDKKNTLYGELRLSGGNIKE